jgi:hypothetical protein
MTEGPGPARPAEPPAADMVVHKSTRECPMIQPHPRASCGIVRAREANQDRASASAGRLRSGAILVHDRPEDEQEGEEAY